MRKYHNFQVNSLNPAEPRGYQCPKSNSKSRWKGDAACHKRWTFNIIYIKKLRNSQKIPTREKSCIHPSEKETNNPKQIPVVCYMLWIPYPNHLVIVRYVRHISLGRIALIASKFTIPREKFNPLILKHQSINVCT